MNRKIYFLSAFFMLVFLVLHTSAQDEPVKRKYTLTHHMSPEEKALFHTVGDGYEATDPPPGVIHNIAEYEQMEGVLVGYPGAFGISYELIAAMSNVVPVTTIVENNSQLNFVTAQYEASGVNMDNTNFLVTALDSYWTRDYGPWYIRYGDDQIGIMDFIYNRPNRPNDNAVPPQMAEYLDIEWFGMGLITAGGNYMTDGYGISAASDLTWLENPTLSPDEIDQMLLEYCGIETYHVLPDPNNTYIDHIDCWGKFLDVDKVLIREVPPTHPQYDEIEETAAYFENEVSAWGNNFEVYRVMTPNDEPYTNSLILNDHVFLPIMGGQWDDEAVAAYEEAMPGYEIHTFTGSWESTDALHCRTKGIADRNTLYIEHYPFLGEQEVLPEYEIEAIVTAYSGESIDQEEVKVIWWINGVLQDEIVMIYEGDKVYSATLPAGLPGSEMAYYITASDEGGNMANHPFIGEPDPHVFYVGEQLFAALSLDVAELTVSAEQGTTAQETLNITNTGDIELNYEIEYSSAMLEDYTFDIDDSPSPTSWEDNTLIELGWTEYTVSGVVGEIGGWSITFDWDVDQYVDESTFYVESPDGTQTVIAAGLPDGTYTIDLDAFNGEGMQGEWKLWLTDSYGDGGHQATNITMTITKTYTIFPWLSVTPISGTAQPDETQTIDVMCAASVMPVGDYEGTIWISSNDPDFPEVEVPVHFTVDVSSGLEDSENTDFIVKNYPNPFSQQTVFEIRLADNQSVSFLIFNGNGQVVNTLVRKALPKGISRIVWDGSGNNGRSLPNGIYYYRLETETVTEIGKLILN